MNLKYERLVEKVEELEARLNKLEARIRDDDNLRSAFADVIAPAEAKVKEMLDTEARERCCGPNGCKVR